MEGWTLLAQSWFCGNLQNVRDHSPQPGPGALHRGGKVRYHVTWHCLTLLLLRFSADKVFLTSEMTFGAVGDRVQVTFRRRKYFTVNIISPGHRLGPDSEAGWHKPGAGVFVSEVEIGPRLCCNSKYFRANGKCCPRKYLRSCNATLAKTVLRWFSSQNDDIYLQFSFQGLSTMMGRSSWKTFSLRYCGLSNQSCWNISTGERRWVESGLSLCCCRAIYSAEARYLINVWKWKYQSPFLSLFLRNVLVLVR